MRRDHKRLIEGAKTLRQHFKNTHVTVAAAAMNNRRIAYFGLSARAQARGARDVALRLGA
jgi:hypothetical protein